jgi:hypothetical protein
VQQVDQDLAEAIFVAADPQDLIWNVEPDSKTLPLGEQPQPFRGRLGQPNHIHVIEEQLGCAALDPR